MLPRFAIVVAVFAMLAPVGAIQDSHPWPTDAEAIIVLEGASRLRETPAGSALAEAALATAFFDRTNRAWAALAERLGWSPKKAFDELLGRRSTLILTGLNAEVDPAWVLVCEVTRETEARFRDRMQLAQRDIRNNAKIAVGEEGKFKLGVAGRRNGPFTFVLAPAEYGALFDKVVESKRLTEVGAGDRPASLSITYRPRVSGGSRGTLMLRAASAADQKYWEVEFTSTPDIFRLPQPAEALPRAWVANWASDVVARGPSCDTCDAVSVFGAGPEVLGGIGDFLVKILGLDGDLNRGGAGFEGGSVEARRFASMRFVDMDGRLAPELTVALEVPPEDASVQADKHMSAFLGRVTGRPAPEFEGVLPGVPRVAAMRVDPGRGPEQTLMWTTRQSGDSALWFVRLSPRGSNPETLREFRELANGFAQPGDHRDLVSAGAIRPSALLAWSKQTNPAGGSDGGLGPLAWFPLVTWSASLHEGQVVGRARVYVRSDASPRP